MLHPYRRSSEGRLKRISGLSETQLVAIGKQRIFPDFFNLLHFNNKAKTKNK
jgi:hypothetical protein